ncbi:pyridine nucleotide-disulfide oxidoreductase [Pseudoxanthomonas broegbernensis]|uniref:Pyridine nucleotide-disulfide oxidoreductase n=1 Tax=Pseudoxanthomonas broegbernensis TaxID=83619 RepID=A0A7V8GKH5_9GAMM|nr:FAD/NAD(P)-binding protein [Pseudoxanthomonas broegbernensis]KAF1685079.1 pyridine nucleotide-disulfide oxidoreductase [Pseudoxanthomonas broegbernensis]MBB6066259.1 putative NAD(P)/FAD-binding protein YdhS [Pseudoxanthomonas broegbernensis]
MRITIIGAGFSGSVLATELARNAPPGVDLCLVGLADGYGRGVAYGEARPEHLLNVRARDMGATQDQPAEFARWLNLTRRAEESFLPRLVYGEYLYSRLQSAAQVSLAGFNQVQQEAVAVDREGGAFRVMLADGSDFLTDRVVLAVGTLPPQRLQGVGPRLLVDPAYVAWPWQRNLRGADALADVPDDARVLIVGTGLTMADTVVTLRRRGHHGPITALSRHGLLPHPHLAEPGLPIALPPAVLHALNGADVRALLRALRSLAPVVPDWRSLVDALRPSLQGYWKTLPDEQRGRFLRHLRSYWEVVRHRLAPSLHEELEQLRGEGRLRLRAGRLLRARRGEAAVEVLIRERGQAHASAERYDVLVRATGLDTDIERTSHPLVSQLRDAGTVSADPHGLGLRATPQFEVLDRHGAPVRGLYCLGPLLRGQLWEITAVPELRVAARHLAEHLLAPAPSRVVREMAPRVASRVG